MTWQEGQILLDTYEVKGVLGEGGMGTVYQVHHNAWNIDLALKQPKPDVVARVGVETFVNEAQAWVDLGLHPHIATCHYVRKIDELPCVFAELVEGGSLADWIEKGRLRKLEDMLDVAIQFAWGLHYAHELGMIHQDVKPDNVMMKEDGTAKVTDFGLVKVQARRQLIMSSKGTMLAEWGGGTPAYFSPEQSAAADLAAQARQWAEAGEKEFSDKLREQIGQLLKPTRRTDLWSWGLSVLEMFTGERTWAYGSAAAEHLKAYMAKGPAVTGMPEMPREVGTLLGECFEEDPQRRPRDMHEAAQRLIELYRKETGRAYSRQEPKAADLQADSVNNKALSIYDLGQVEEAYNWWMINLKANPGHLESTYNMGLINWRMGESDDSSLLRDLQAAAESIDSWRKDWLVSQVHLERGDIQQATVILEALHAAAANNPEVAMLHRQAADLEGSGYRLRHAFAGHNAYVTCVCLSADGHVAFSGSEDKTLLLWDLTTGLLLRRFVGHTERVTGVCLSKDESFALSSSWDNTLKLWEVATGKCIRTFEGHKKTVGCVCLSEDEHFTLSGSSDRTLKLWNIHTGQCLRTFEGHAIGAGSVSLSKDGTFAVSGSADKTAMMWDVVTGRCIRTFEGHTGGVNSVCLSGDDRFMLTGSSDKTLKLWELATGQCLRTFEGHTGWVNSVCLSADDRFALSGSADGAWMISTGSLKLWNLATGECLRTFNGHDDRVSSVQLSQDGQYALSGSYDATLRLWDLMSGACLRIMTGHPDSVRAISLSEDERYALSGCGDRKLRLWDLTSGVCLRIFTGHKGAINSVSLSADGRLALSGGGDFHHGDNTPRLWDVDTGECLHTFEGHTDMVASVCLSADGHSALSGSMDQTLKLWDTGSGECLRTFEGHKGGVLAVGINRDGRFALSKSNQGTIKLWDMDTGECLRTLDIPNNAIDLTYLSPDELETLLKYKDDTLRLWNLAPKVCLRTFLGEMMDGFWASFSADGRYTLQWGYQDGCFRLWNTARARCLRTFESGTQSAYLSRDGRFALSGGSDTPLKIWDLNPDYTFSAPFAVARFVTSEVVASVADLLANVQTAHLEGDTGRELRFLKQARSMPGYENNLDIREAWSRLYVKTRRSALRGGWLARTFEGHTGSVDCVCLSRDEFFALSGSWDKTLKMWETATGRCIRTFEGHTSRITCISLNANEKFVLSGSEDGTFKLWELGTGKCMRTFNASPGYVTAICQSRDGRFALTGSTDGIYAHTGKINVWELASGRCLRTFVGPTTRIHALCLSGDERYVLSGGEDGVPKLWKVSKCRGIKKYLGHTGPISSVYLSGDGSHVLSASHDATIKLWNLATMKCVRTFEGHTNWVGSVCLSEDGRYVLSGGAPKNLKLWEVETGQCLRTFEGHTGWVNSVCLSADGRYALSGSSDNTLKLWELDWELEYIQPSGWNEGARCYLQNFLNLHTPYGYKIPSEHILTEEEFCQVFSRAGRPNWEEEDFENLLLQLGCAGYGWLRPEGVRRKLEEMASGRV